MNKNNFFKKVIILFTIIITTLFLLEFVMKKIGYKPWEYIQFGNGIENEPIINLYDEVLGWRGKEGKHTIAPYHPSASTIHMKILENGQRKTSNKKINRNKEIVIVGGSFTQGWAISDKFTFPWLLQNKIPDFKISNYGTLGFSTYQSLLYLERVLPKSFGPKYILYGFFDHHENRNVAESVWLKSISASSSRGHLKIPFATIDKNDNLLRHSPKSYPNFPFKTSSALITKVEQAYMNIKTHKRFLQKRKVTEKILLEMDKLSIKHSATFIVLMLSLNHEYKNHYSKFFQKNNLQYIDCNLFPITPDLQVRNERHPNETAHAIWANVITSQLKHHIRQNNNLTIDIVLNKNKNSK